MIVLLASALKLFNVPTAVVGAVCGIALLIAVGYAIARTARSKRVQPPAETAAETKAVETPRETPASATPTAAGPREAAQVS